MKLVRVISKKADDKASDQFYEQTKKESENFSDSHDIDIMTRLDLSGRNAEFSLKVRSIIFNGSGKEAIKDALKHLEHLKAEIKEAEKFLDDATKKAQELRKKSKGNK